MSYASDPAGCDCGFMSVERMRIVLGLETVGYRNVFHSRQQITPSIKFTCDGLITKWIIGAGWLNNGNSYPELQVWRNIGSDLYRKINGTFINILVQNPSKIYEYDTFSPIPVLAGDILGVFMPDYDSSKPGLWSEKDNGPLTYYIATGETATESPFDTIDLQEMSSLSSQTYHPLVTLEILPRSSLSSSPLTSLPPELVHSTTPPSHNTGGDGATINNVSLFVGVGVAGTLFVLIAATAIITTVSVCLRKKNKLNTTDRVVYQSTRNEERLSYNVAYPTIIDDHSLTSDDREYMFITTLATEVNVAASGGSSSATAEACNIPTSSNEITMSTNEAYSRPTTTDGVYHIPTSINAAYEITTSTSPFVATDAFTSTNQPYEAAEYQSGSDSPTYDYIISHDCLSN